MKWLQDNLLGRTLAGISGLLLLTAMLMAIVWTLPPRVDGGGPETDTEQSKIKASSGLNLVAVRELERLENYQVINEKPVFNESRQPEVAEPDDDELSLEDSSIAVKDAPDVRLTGVIITPALRIASLTPAKSGEESVMAHEGQVLTGEYVGWQLASVHPRNVVLASSDGQSLQLELEVHDAKIKEPPKPVVADKSAPESTGLAAEDDGGSDEPLSRAEQIRQRIAERREELRREQEEQQAERDKNQAKKSESYQNAIRAMMRNNSKDQSSNDKEKG